MKIILTNSIKGLGEKDDVVTVKNGYARNYLIPKGKAKVATSSNMRMLEEDLKQREFKMDKLRKDAEAIAAKINGHEVTIKTKAGASGKIFGSITSVQVAQALKDSGFEVDRRRIAFDDIKNIGEYTAELNLFKGISSEITIKVEVE